MPRKTAKEEATKVMAGFIANAKEKQLGVITSTRQPKRRKSALTILDGLDLVEREFYDYVNGLGGEI